jgi:hypothetical protein
MDKKSLLQRMRQSRETFLAGIEGLTPEQMSEPGVAGEWSVKDIITHLNMWEADLIKAMFQAQNGLIPETANISDAEVEKLNQQWQQEFVNRPLDQVLADFKAVRAQTERRLEGFSEDDLNNPRRFPWMKGRPFTRWIAEDTYEHEAEHLESILAWRRKKGFIH